MFLFNAFSFNIAGSLLLSSISRILKQCSKSSCWKYARWINVPLASDMMGVTQYYSWLTLCTTTIHFKHQHKAWSSRWPPHSPSFLIPCTYWQILPSYYTSMKLVKNYWLLSMYLQAYSLKNKCVFQVPSSWSAIDRNRQFPSPATSFSFNLNIYNSWLNLSQYCTYYLVNLNESPLPAFFIRLQIYFYFLRCYFRYYRFYQAYFFLSFLLFPPIIINLLLTHPITLHFIFCCYQQADHLISQCITYVEQDILE